MWRGYLGTAHHAKPFEWCRTAGAAIECLHTSGHAGPTDLRAFAAAVSAKAVVPVYGENWNVAATGFGAVRKLIDGETWTLP